MRRFLGHRLWAIAVNFAAFLGVRRATDSESAGRLAALPRILFLILGAFTLFPALAAGQVSTGNGPLPVPPINANLYGVLPSPAASDNSLAMQAAIAAAAAIGAAVSIPECGTYSFTNPITGPTSAPIPIPNGMKIFAPGGYQCVRFQVSSSWTGTSPALIDELGPTQGITLQGITWDGNSKSNVGLIWFTGAPNDQIVLRDNRITGVKGASAVLIGSISAAFPTAPTPTVTMTPISLPSSVYVFATIPTNIGEIDASTIFPLPTGTPFPIPTTSALLISPPSALPTPSWSPGVPYVCVPVSGGCGYNVYAGTTAGMYGLQNSAPIPMSTSYILTTYTAPNPSASPGTLGYIWNGSGIPTTSSRLTGNLIENNSTGLNEVVQLTAWQDSVVDNNVFRNNVTCKDALGIYVYTYHITVSGNQFDSNLCSGGDYYVEGSRDVQFVANQHLMAAPSPTPTGATNLPQFAILVQNGKAISIDDMVDIESGAVGTYAMFVQDNLEAVGYSPETADTISSNEINVVPHWALGLTAGGGLILPVGVAASYTSTMHDIYVKGGSIWMNNPNAPAGWAGGVIVNCMHSPSTVNNVTVQGVDFPSGTMAAPAPTGTQGQAPIEFVGNSSTCTNLRAYDNSIGFISAPTGTSPSPSAIVAVGGSVAIKGNDLSAWPSLSTAIYSSSTTTLSDVGNVIPSPGMSSTTSPALGFLGINASNCVQGNAQGAFTIISGPCMVGYQSSGSPPTSTSHCVIDKVTAPTSPAPTPPTSVTFSASAVFADSNYTLLIQDVTLPGGTPAPATPMPTGFTFTSTVGHTYAYMACGT